MKTPEISTWTFEDQDEQIDCVSQFMNYMMELEDEHRKEIGPEEYHYATESLHDVDISDPADKDLQPIFRKLKGYEKSFLEYALDEGIFSLRLGQGHRIYTGEITSWNDDSYSVGTLGYSGTVNGKEVDDVFMALCEGLSKEQINKALRKSNFSSVEQYVEDTNIPEYIYAESDDYTRVLLCANETDDALEEIVDKWLTGLRRGVPNKAGRSVIVDKKKFVYEDKKEIKKNPLVVKKIKQYLSNPEKNPAYASKYCIRFYDKDNHVGDMSLSEFRESMKAPLSISIDTLIERFNRCMKEKAKLIKRKNS